MNRRFLLILLGSLVAVGLVVFLSVEETHRTAVQLNGSVTNSRLVKLAEGYTLAMVDFEATNPAKTGFEINEVELLARKGADLYKATIFGKRDLEDYLAYEKYTPKQAQIGFGEQVRGGETAKRMIAGRFDVPMEMLKGAEFEVRLTNVNHVRAELKQKEEKGKKR